MIGAMRLLAQLALVASAPSEARVREALPVRLEVTAPPGATVQVTPPSFAPFRLVSASRVERSAALGGGASPVTGWSTVEYRYMLLPTRAGTFTLPPFQARSTQGTGRSNALRVTVRDDQRPHTAGEPAIVSRARIDPAVGVNFHALVQPETVYVGQQATYQVGVFLDDDVRRRLRRNPEFLPPELRSMLAYDLPAGRAFIRSREIGGRRYDVHVFQRAIFPLTPGRYDVPPAQLVYSLPITPGFFSREESYTARAESATVVALAPPAAGRPADFSGAVGRLQMSARLDAAGARVGDPMVLVLRVEGVGNVKLLPRPAVQLGWADAVPSHERVRVDSASLLVRGSKEFEWILTPRRAGVQELPALRYAYFDPYVRRYEVASTTPVPVTVAPGTLAAADAGGAQARPLPLRTEYRGPVAPALPSRAAYWILLLAAPLPAAVIMFVKRPKPAPRAEPASVRLRALAEDAADGPRDARTLRRTFAAAISSRLALPHDASARAGSFARALRRRGVSPEVADVAELLLRELDAAAYAGLSARDGAVARRAWDVYRRVDEEARAEAVLSAVGRLTRTRSATGALVCVMLAAAAAHAVVVPGTLFSEGVSAYEARDYGTARRAFARAATEEPASPDAWANAGTAAWAAGDTAAAVEGWQRAARLDPLRGEDVRAHLALTGMAHAGTISEPPRVPVNVAAMAAAALWLIGCALAAWCAARRIRLRSPLGRAALACVLAAMIAGAVTAQAMAARTARDLAVVASGGPVRDEPAMAASPGSTVHTGEIARTLGQQSAWTRVRMDDGREGWMETERLRPLAERVTVER